MRVLIIESDKQVCNPIEEVLKKQHQIDCVENFKDGDYYIGVRNYDLVIAGYALKDGSVFDIIKKAKDKAKKTPVIIVGPSYLDNQDASIDAEIKSFKAGADDYIFRPINKEAFLVRIEARLKLGGNSVIKIEDLEINPDEEKITYKGQEIEVKGKPFEVLTHLARHRDQIVSKDQLLDAIWEEPELVTPNVIEVAINQIRQKMDKPLNISTIETVRRRGYRFCYPKFPTQ